MGEPQKAPAKPDSLSALSLEAAPPDTKERLLDASESLFAERGFDGTSMRAVTHAAGASLSAANYHFGSKEALLRAVLRRRIEPLNQGRLELLGKAEAAGSPLSVEQILDAFMRPALELRGRTAQPQALARHVAARLFADPPEVVSELKAELMGDVHARFAAAIEQALPRVSPERRSLILEFAVGLVVHVLSGQVDAWPAAGHSPDGGDAGTEALIRTLVRFAAAGAAATAEEAS